MNGGLSFRAGNTAFNRADYTTANTMVVATAIRLGVSHDDPKVGHTTQHQTCAYCASGTDITLNDRQQKILAAMKGN